MSKEDKRIILDLCGGSGSWSLPYKEKGYDVKNITLPNYDVRDYQPPENIYGILAAPPCEQFSYARGSPEIARDLKKGMELVIACLNIIWRCQYRYKNQHQKLSPLKFWVLENPYYGSLNWFLGEPKFLFQPYEFGDAYKKKTALWGHFNVPKKEQFLPLDELRNLKSIANDPGNPKTRKRLRAITPPHFAKAFFEANP